MIVMKRKISCILAAAMLFGMLPVAAFASDEVSETSQPIPELTEYETLPEDPQIPEEMQETESVPETDPAAEPETETDSESEQEAEQEEVHETEQENEILTGDVDGDGEVTTADAMQILKYVANLIDTVDLSQADADKDGMVTAVDAALVLRYCAGLSDALPAQNAQ